MQGSRKDFVPLRERDLEILETYFQLCLFFRNLGLPGNSVFLDNGRGAAFRVNIVR